MQDRRSDPRFKRPWLVRWRVDAKEFTRNFRTKQEADHYRSVLLVSQRDGEVFDQATGEPARWRPAADDVQVHVWARRWLAEQWAEWQPRTRRSAVEAIARFVPLVVQADASEPPPRLRRHLIETLPPDARIDHESPEERWLHRSCLPLGQLDRSVLGEVDRRLGLGDDEQMLAPATAGRYRKVARACIRRAVDLDVLAADPWPSASRGRSQRKAIRKRTMDIRLLPDPATVARALEAMVTHQPASERYMVMTAVAYYAGLRPSEVVVLRPRALTLPTTGWGVSISPTPTSPLTSRGSRRRGCGACRSRRCWSRSCEVDRRA